MTTRTIEGIVSSVLIGRDPDSLVTTRQEEVRVAFEGLEGDKHAGMLRPSDSRTPRYPRGTIIRNRRQISIVSDEELEYIAQAMDLPIIRPEWLGANLSIRGVPDLTLIPPTSRIFFPDEAAIIIDAENLPCTHPGRIIQKQYPDRPDLADAFPKAALHKRGLVAWVERPGVIRTGDAIKIDLAPQVSYSF